MKKYGFVYLWRDHKHKRYYVGSHWGSIDDGYICSSKWMMRSYAFRPEDFKRRVLSLHSNKQDMIAEEARVLNMIKPEEIKPINDSPRYYNLRIKAWETWHADPHQRKTIGQKISAAKKGKPIIFTYPEERARKISEAKKGTTFTEEHRQKLSEAQTGKTQSLETRQKRSATLKRGWQNGTRKLRKFEVTDEYRSKLSASKKGKPGRVQTEQDRLSRSKTWSITAPDGTTRTVTNLRRFCQENGLLNTNITKPSGSKGYRATKYVE